MIIALSVMTKCCCLKDQRSEDYKDQKPLKIEAAMAKAINVSGKDKSRRRGHKIMELQNIWVGKKL